MNETRLILKQPTGWFAAGKEMQEALTILSDGAFKLYAYLCLNADRRTAQFRFRAAELASATGKSVRSITTYLEELRQAEVCSIDRASNQHEFGRIEVRDRFWPYEKPAASPQTPEQDSYVAKVRELFLEKACVQSVFSAADHKLAAQWYRNGVALDLLARAFLLGSARKYVALFNHSTASPVTSLQYFAGALDDVAKLEESLDYWRYLAMRVKKMEAQWRAQANLAAPIQVSTAPELKETK
jgi:hypothetical protein